MTIARILCLIFACAALLASIANADQSGSQNSSAPTQGSNEALGHPRKNANPAKSGGTKARTGKPATRTAQPSHNETMPGQTHGSPETENPNSTAAVSNGRTLASPGIPRGPAQTSNSRGVHARNTPTIPGATITNALPGPPPSVASRLTAQSSSPRHHNPNPPVVSGAMNSNAHSSAAINGTGMHRKP